MQLNTECVNISIFPIQMLIGRDGHNITLTISTICAARKITRMKTIIKRIVFQTESISARKTRTWIRSHVTTSKQILGKNICNMYTKKEIIELLRSARNILHKNEVGQEVSNLDIVRAHDQIDIVLDAMIQENLDILSFLT